MQCRGATVLMTGASGGIGRAVAAALYERGARLVLHARHAEALAQPAAAFGARIVTADLAEPGAAQELAQEAGRVDAVVHCAGIGARAALAGTDPAVLDRLVAVNLLAPIELTREVLPHLLSGGSGHLAFVASVAGLAGVRREATYAATKAGLLAFASSLRLELAGTGVEVSTVSPAAVQTGFWAARGVPYHRHRPRPVPPALVADAVVRGMQRGGGDRAVPRWVRAASLTAAACPRGYAALAARFDR